MFRPFAAGGPERVELSAAEFVPNELLFTAAPEAQNDELPHYLSVAAGSAEPRRSFGLPAVDGLLGQLGARSRSFTRVYVPTSSAPMLAARGPVRLAAGDGALPAIPASYDEEERRAGFSRTYRVTLEEDANVPQLCRALAESKLVERAQPNYLSHPFQAPSDTYYPLQWGLPVIRAEEAWELETGHPDTLVAIVDSGVDLDHPDLQSKLEPGHDFVDYLGSGGWRYQLLGDYRTRDPLPDDEDGHGSHCAGIAAGASDNGRGTAGLHWGGRVLPVRVMFRVYDRLQGRESSIGTTADIDAGIKFAVDSGADVINLSLGGSQPSHEAVLQYAYDHGVVVVAATGNDNSSAPSYPASNPNVLAVGAVDQSLARASFSNYGSAYGDFVVAPGVQIASTYKEGGYVYLQGTSMATPFVAGLAALMISLARRSGHELPVQVVYDIIRSSARALGSGKGDAFFGQGLIDCAAALEAVRERLECEGVAAPAKRGRRGSARKRASARS